MKATRKFYDRYMNPFSDFIHGTPEGAVFSNACKNEGKDISNLTDEEVEAIKAARKVTESDLATIDEFLEIVEAERG